MLYLLCMITQSVIGVIIGKFIHEGIYFLLAHIFLLLAVIFPASMCFLEEHHEE